jgi:hypothetical protein
MLAAAIETASPLREVATVSEPAAKPPEPERPAAPEPPPSAAPVWSQTVAESPVLGGAQADAPQPANGRNAIAEAFASLLAIEQGERGASAPSLEVTLWAPVMTSAFVDEVARRVIERLAPEAAQGVVERVVSDVAERLVREEMGRAKSTGRWALDGRS